MHWCKQGFEQLHATRGRQSAIYHGVISPLRILKQIAVMFFDTGGDRFRLKYPELVRFVLDPSRTGLPPEYRFYVFWYGGGSLRQTGVAGLASIAGGTLSVLAEVVHPPFGYLLATGGPLPDSRPRDISDFADYGDAERIDLHRRLPVLQTHTPIPGDYRTAEQLLRDMRQSELAAAGHPDSEAGPRGA